MSFPARIRRLDRPVRGALALSLTSAGERFVLLACCRPEASGAAIVDERPRGAPADGFTSMLRRKLVGATVTEVRGAGGVVEIALVAEDGPLRLVLATGGRSGAIALYGADGCARLSAGTMRDDADRRLEPLPLEALRARGEALARSLAGAEEAARLAALRRAVDRARKHLARKLAAIEADAARAELVPELRADASALLASLYAIPRGATRFDAIDYTVDPPGTRAVAIDPALGPKAQAEALFKKARRLERGAKIAAERSVSVAAAIEPLDRLARAIAEHGAAELDRLEAEAAAAGIPLEGEAPTSRTRAAKRKPYRAFVSADGLAILVGRSAEDNDELTLRHARPHDLWLHARGTSGSHVVVPLEREQACPPATLADAATLAGHFSRFRSDRDVEVLYTPRRYVRKRRGSPAGSVSVEREKVMLVSMEPPRVARLLASERK